MKSTGKPKVKVTLSVTLRQLSQLMDESEVFEVRAASALECLQIMVRRYPSMKKWVYDNERKVRPLLWFFVNDPAMRAKLAPEQFTDPLKDNDEVILFFGKT